MTIDGPELIVFDFDETIIGCNSDTFINQLAPNGIIPNDIIDHWDNDNWTQYMKEVFLYLSECNVRESDIRGCLKTMPLVSGMKQLINNCYTNGNYEMIILSDANTVFINDTLAYHQLDRAFRKVFTNPAKFDENGTLQIDEYHIQDYCKLSARNLCKGQVLMDYIHSRKEDDGIVYSRVSYVGDGQNDVCPSLKLGPNDRVFARLGFPLHKRLNGNRQLIASVYGFSDGFDIWKVMEKSSIYEKQNNNDNETPIIDK